MCNSRILPLAMQHAGRTQAFSVTHIPVQHVFNFVRGCKLTSHFLHDDWKNILSYIWKMKKFPHILIM